MNMKDKVLFHKQLFRMMETGDFIKNTGDSQLQVA